MNFDITGPLPTGTTVLEASAGTGKTWTIAALATRLVAEEDIKVTDLLLITFTRAATTELRSRVRENLVNAAKKLTGLGTGEESLDVVDDLFFFLATGTSRAEDEEAPLLPEAELHTRISRLDAAVADIDAATITTIHGFCHTALHGLGVAGDNDARLTLSESADDIRDEVVDDVYLRTFLHSEEEPSLKYDDAKKIAKEVTGNPSAVIYPQNTEGLDAPTTQRRTFAADVRNEFQHRKRDLGILTYDDLLTTLAEIVDPQKPEGTHPEEARKRLRQRWTHVLVDEFQDTDDTQWRILDAIFHGHRNLTLIGDPKQAIYSFRGGDIKTYLAATKNVASRFTLGHNYRSDSELIASLNGLLRGTELGDEQICVRDVEPGKKRTDVRLATGKYAARLRIRVLDAEKFQTVGNRVPGIVDLRNAIADDVAVDVAHLLSAGHKVYETSNKSWRSAEAGDVAVLCHLNKDARRVQRALIKQGVHAVVSGGESVFQSQGAQDWLTLLDAMEQPSNTSAVRAAALTPFFGYTAEDLLDNTDEVLDEVSSGLREYPHILTADGAASVFEAAQDRGEEGMAARLLQYIGGERLLTDLRHVAELMHAAQPRAGAHTLAAWLRREREDSSRNEHVRRLESDDSAVQLYTIHSAKGLQFPFVYVPTTGTETLPRVDYPVFHLGGQRTVNVAGKPQGELKKVVEEESKAERSRMLYVALTRGIGQVTVYWAPAQNIASTALHRLLTRNGEEFNGKTPIEEVYQQITQRWGEFAQVELVEDRPPLAVPAVPEPPIGKAKEWTRTIDFSWRRSSYTSLSGGAQTAGEEPGLHFKETLEELEAGPLEAEAAIETPEVEHLPSPMADLPRGAKFGSLVHGVLETINTRAADLDAEIAQRVGEQLHQWPLELDIGVLADAIRAVLTTPLAPAVEESLLELDPTEKLAELDFELPLDGGEWATGGTRTTLRDLAPILRKHLRRGDPLLPYANVIDTPEFETQSLRGYLTGSIDLVFRAGEKFYVADYKTNWLGAFDEPNTTRFYDREAVNTAMEGSSYPLQALLYTVALHRYLTWRLPGYDPTRHIGGVLYLYVRGMAGRRTPVVEGHATGVFYWNPPAGLIADISALLNGKGDAGGERS